jgi:thioredoxin reductase (NADPH)
MEYDSVTAVDFSHRPFKITTYSKEYLAESVILATGASPVHLNIPGEELLTGKGVSYCATCDGWFFKGKEVAVVGGGDSALEEALFLTRFATKVTVIHRRDAFRAGAILQKRLRENEKIATILDTVVESVIGEEKVKGLKLHNVKTGEKSDFACDGAFIFIGHSPNTQLYQGQLEMDERGYLKIDQKMQTSVPGVFAAGEVADSTYKQVVTSAGMGAAAAIQALHFLEE